MHIGVVVSPRVLITGLLAELAGPFHFGNVYLSVSTLLPSLPLSDYDIHIKPASPSWLSELGFPAFINNKPRHLPFSQYVSVRTNVCVYVRMYVYSRIATPSHIRIVDACTYTCTHSTVVLYASDRLCIRSLYEGACISEAVERGANT